MSYLASRALLLELGSAVIKKLNHPIEMTGKIDGATPLVIRKDNILHTHTITMPQSFPSVILSPLIVVEV